MRRVHSYPLIPAILAVSLSGAFAATDDPELTLADQCQQQALEEGVAKEDVAAYVEECLEDHEQEPGVTEKTPELSKEEES